MTKNTKALTLADFIFNSKPKPSHVKRIRERGIHRLSQKFKPWNSKVKHVAKFIPDEAFVQNETYGFDVSLTYFKARIENQLGIK